MNKQSLQLLLLFSLVLLSRLPFLFAGYGVEEDSWGIALAAFHTKMSGIYEPSRFPGHPIHEYILSALWGFGPVLYNFLSALFSAITVVFFSLILQSLKFKQHFIAALAFAFTPVFFISSTYTIDYAWSEAFVLGATYFLLKRKFYLSGVFLGLAVGCRITSGAILLPFFIMIWENGNVKKSFQTILKVAIPTIVIPVLAFVPVAIRFGSEFFMYYDQFPYPPITKVLYKMTIGVLGFVGTIVLFYFIIKRILFFKKRETKLFELPIKIRIASFVIITLYTISYFRLPQKSAYLIPLIPFIILMMAHYLTKKEFYFLCCSLILSSFFCSINLTDKQRGATYSQLAIKTIISRQEIFFDPLSGPIFSDYAKRKLKIKYTDEVIEKAKNISKKTVIIAGWWYNEIMVELITRSENKYVHFVDYINKKQIDEYLGEGNLIYYLPEQNVYNDLMHTITVTDSVAKPF